MTLRPYQSEAIEAVDKFIASNDRSGVLLEPVATGKSIIVAYISKRFEGKVLCLQPSKELLLQDVSMYNSIGANGKVSSATL